MNEFEERLNGLLSDPAAMEQVSRLASQLLGGEEDGSAPAAGALPERLSRLLGSAGGGDKIALVQALAPYLHPTRQEKLQKALRIARMACLARLALREEGADV